MSGDAIERIFREKVSAQVELLEEGKDRFRVFTPFTFGDGDHLVIVLKREDTGWWLSDEGHTYMRLTYRMDEKDLHKGTRQKIISNALALYSVEDRNGELRIDVEGDRYGDALYSFIQAILKITDVSYLAREYVRSTFMDDFRALFSETVPEERRSFGWNDPQHDPDGIYTVDCRVNGSADPLFVYALANDGKTRDATIALLQFGKWGLSFNSLAIFQDQEAISRKVLARFTDVGGKQFSSLPAARDGIGRYLETNLSG